MAVVVVLFMFATGVEGQRVVVLITQISLMSDAFEPLGFTVIVLRAVPFCAVAVGPVD